jgi:hypothetical protein
MSRVRRRVPRPHSAFWIAICCALIAVGGSLVGTSIRASASGALPGTAFVPADGQTYLGVSTHLITTGVDAWDRAAGIGTRPALYGRWTTPDGPFAPILTEVATRPGVAPIIHWNLPMDNGQITSGSQDAYISSQAAAVAAYGKPVFVRLDWEMNANWYPHWRHVVSLFAGVQNVTFVWAPNVNDYNGQSPMTWYPGDQYVGWVGLDAYPQSAPATHLLNDSGGMNEFARFAAAHNKPLMLAEWAPNTPHPDTADPINLVIDWAEQYPATVKALVYFDFQVGTKDFRLASHPVGAATFRARTSNHCRYVLTLVASNGDRVPCVRSQPPPIASHPGTGGGSPHPATVGSHGTRLSVRVARQATIGYVAARYSVSHMTIACRRISVGSVRCTASFRHAHHHVSHALVVALHGSRLTIRSSR